MNKISVVLVGLILSLNCPASGECLVKVEAYCGYEAGDGECVINEDGSCGGLEYHEGLDEGLYYTWFEESWPFGRVQPEEIYEFDELYYASMDCGEYSDCYGEWDENENLICKSDPSTVFNERIIQNSTTACVEF